MVAAALGFAFSGSLFVVSAQNSGGSDLRPGRYTDLASLVRNESRQVAAVQQQVAQLQDEVDRLTDAVRDRRVQEYRRKAASLRGVAGLQPVTGPGITVTLSDAPAEVINSSTREGDRFIVHQQDIQAVVNAFWKAGALGVTVQGQRIVTTTGIKCDGNAVQLQGIPYPQPYVISAVGDQAALLAALENDLYVQAFRSDAALSDVAVGWQLDSASTLTLPAYEGLLDLSYATPLES